MSIVTNFMKAHEISMELEKKKKSKKRLPVLSCKQIRFQS